MKIIERPIILASGSPRRQFLMREAGFDFTIDTPNVDESFPESLPSEQVARYLAAKKAEQYRLSIGDQIIVTADTVVILESKILNKPGDHDEAVDMLQALSGRTHLVMTGVCILSKEKEETFDDTTEVTFKNLSKEEINYYVKNYKPFDKAGAYGAQDWIGMVAIEKLSGSYFNVMGFPIHKVYQHLSRW